MECVVDTNVLIHDTIEDSEFHEAAASDLGRLSRWLVPTVVIEEYVSVLWKLGLKKGFIGRKISEFMASRVVEVVPVENEDIEMAAELISRERTSFRSFNDKLVVSIAKRRKAFLLTFDKDLKEECMRFEVQSPPSERIAEQKTAGKV